MVFREPAASAENAESQAEKIIARIKQFIEGYHYPYDRWYVGISDDPRSQLLDGHRVNPRLGTCIQVPVPSAEVATAVTRHFIELGADGRTGHATGVAKYVYVYKKSMHTKP